MSKTIRKSKSNISKSAEIVVANTCATEVLADDLGSVAATLENQQTGIACEEAIRVLAHSKWEAAGCPAGDGSAFWLEAEREVSISPQADN